MNAKRSTQAARWVDPEANSIPAGAVVAREIVFQQLAFEALAMSILRAPTPSESVEVPVRVR